MIDITKRYVSRYGILGQQKYCERHSDRFYHTESSVFISIRRVANALRERATKGTVVMEGFL